ncbi:hypothetical protein F5Y03DRAFT_348094 [Xylaria venustula]|nr:hypothetical protein F5Y03DRAFT_348094 [Xylaria venustula]
METYLCLLFSCLGQNAACVYQTPGSSSRLSSSVFSPFVIYPSTPPFSLPLSPTFSPSSLLFFPRNFKLLRCPPTGPWTVPSVVYAASPNLQLEVFGCRPPLSPRGKPRPGSQMSLAQHTLPSSGLINSGTGCHTGSLRDAEILWSSWAPSWRNGNEDRPRALVHQPGARTAVAQT